MSDTSIVIVGSGGCLASGFIGLVDILSLAQRAIADSDRGNVPFRILTASVDGLPVKDGHGRFLEVETALQTISACDAIIVPGFVPDQSRRPPLLSGFGTTAAWIRHHHAPGTIVCGSSSGVFLLGAPALLDGRRCTTTWCCMSICCAGPRRSPLGRSLVSSNLF